MQKVSGYEYEVVGYCKRTGKPFLAPIAWATVYLVDGGLVSRQKPVYSTCSCCREKR
jgi:hypothetical protein